MKTKLIDTITFTQDVEITSTVGIFTAIKSVTSQPFEWLTDTMAKWLNTEYYLNHSGQKTISPLFRILREKGLTDAQTINRIAGIVISKFTDKWNKLYSAVIDSDYEPLENYNMEQTETPNITRSRTQTQKTKIETETTNDKTDAKVYGFNSVNPVPSGETNRNGKVTVSGSDTDNVTTDDDTETGTRDLTRHGNIGVTTSQQMLQSEIELRNNYNFIDMLFRDVDSVMTLSIY